MSKWIPTKKWFAAAVGGLTPIVLQAVDAGWHVLETKELVVLSSGLLLAYIMPGPSSPPAA